MSGILGKNVCTIILAQQEKIYNYTSIFPHWWWDHNIRTCVCHHTYALCLPTAACAGEHECFKCVFQQYATTLMKNSCLSTPV